jgi:hypothetical protein
MKALLYILLSLSLSIANAGFVNASFRADYPMLCSKQKWARENLAFSIGWSLFPVLPLIVTPFVTGFYYSGWTLSGDACHDSNYGS